MTPVYCDGSVTNAVWTDVYASHLGDTYAGRAIVVIPGYDFGLIVQTVDGVITARGTPDSTRVEEFAIAVALACCGQLDISDHLVMSDCQGAVDRFSGVRVEHRTRAQMRLPNDFFDKVLRRASYLRTSRPMKRRPIEPHQAEAFELFNSIRREFALSSSALWHRVVADAAPSVRAGVVATS